MTEVFTNDWSQVMDFALKVGIATISGLLIGLEREFKGKSWFKNKYLGRHWCSGICIDFHAVLW